jgi:hypothetical protein
MHAMYFVKIDTLQLQTRLWNCDGFCDVKAWLAQRGFEPTEGGWIASADAMNCLSCSEILYSESATPTRGGGVRFHLPAGLLHHSDHHNGRGA